MDRALKNESEWNADNGYGFRPKSIYRNEWLTPNEIESKAPLLIKLHGSVNWLSSHPMSPKKICYSNSRICPEHSVDL